MERTESVELMNLCMLCRGCKVLVQNRKSNIWPGVAFPGGHIEKGEAFTDAVIREVQEETGLTIYSPRLCGVKDWCEDGVRHNEAHRCADTICTAVRLFSILQRAFHRQVCRIVVR